MDFKAHFNAALLSYVKKYEPTAINLMGYEEEERSTGYCDTCYSEWTVFNIYWSAADGVRQTYTYSGSMAELVEDLTRD